MPQRDRAPDVVRIVEGLKGSVTLRGTLRLRFDYGSVVPWMRRTDGYRVAVAGPDSTWLRADPSVRTWGEDFGTHSEFTVEEGEKVAFVLTWHPSHEPRPPLVDPYDALRDSLADWRDWAGRCRYDGPHRDAVVRSLITLKALTYAPTGGIVAAPTTSLPEEIGGVRNWDYRYCWLRDATLALGALLSAGYSEEAEAWRDWLLRAVAGNPDDLQIMYGLAGERRLPEYEIPWLSGYAGSAPVRVGNDAAHQLQLDVYGEVVDSLALARRAGLRGEAARWRKLRDEVHQEVCEQGYDAERNTFTQYYGSAELDAALLLIPRVGFLPPEDPRVIGTLDAVRDELGHHRLLRRYTADGTDLDGLPGGGARVVRTPGGAEQRRGAALRGVRPGGPAPAGQLPAGIQPYRTRGHRPRALRRGRGRIEPWILD